MTALMPVHVWVLYHPVLDELPALEHTEVLEASRDLIFRYTGERLCNFGAGQTSVSNLVQLPFRIHGEGHEALFMGKDTGFIRLWCLRDLR